MVYNRLLFLDGKLQRKHSPDAVVESAKVGAVQIVLDVARIEVIGNVEDLESTPNPVFVQFLGQREGLSHLQVERCEIRVTFAVPRADKVSVLIDYRIRKALAYIQHRGDAHAPLSPEVAPEEKSVWRVVRQMRTFVRANNRVLEIPKERIEVIEIAGRGGTNIRGHQFVTLRGVKTGSHMKLAVTREAGVA